MSPNAPRDPLAAVDEAIEAVSKLRRALVGRDNAQVTRAEERDHVRATALAWIRGGREAFPATGGPPVLETVDKLYRELFDFSKRSITHGRYKVTFRELKAGLVALRSEAVDIEASPLRPGEGPRPNFSSLVTDAAMQAILDRRWDETGACLRSGAHLAATVMMGAILEALFLSRANRLSDKSVLFKAKTAPKDKAGKTLPLSEWTLRGYIDVAHELGWIRQSARDVSIVLRDWRNYIHPAKQLAHGTSIEADDTAMFWPLLTSLAEQVLRAP